MISAVDLFNSVPALVPFIGCPGKNKLTVSFIYNPLKDILSIGSSCKGCYLWINQETVCRTLIKIMDLDNPLLGPMDLNPKSWNGFLAHQFSILASWHSPPQVHYKESQGSEYGEAFITDAGVMLLDLIDHPLKLFLIEKDPLIKFLEVPEDLRGVLLASYRRCAACSETYIAVSLYEGLVHLFSTKTQEYLFFIPKAAGVLQLEIDKEILFIREAHDQGILQLSLYDLKKREEVKKATFQNTDTNIYNFAATFVHNPMCFGEKYIAYPSSNNNVIIFPYGGLEVYEGNPAKTNKDYEFSKETPANISTDLDLIWDIKSDGEDFIVVGRKNSKIIVYRIGISNEKFFSLLLENEIKLVVNNKEKKPKDIKNIYYCLGRLYICYEKYHYKNLFTPAPLIEVPSWTQYWLKKIISYDLNSQKTCKETFVSQSKASCIFNSCFFNIGTEVFFLTMSLGDKHEVISQLKYLNYRSIKNPSSCKTALPSGN